MKKKTVTKKSAARRSRKQPRTKARSPRGPKLHGLSDIRRFFHRNTDPIFFISATNFNLLGIDEWVRNFWYINYIDCFDGQHPNVFIPREAPHRPFTSIEDINNYLLSHKEVIDFIKSKGGKPKAVFLMFDEETERLCRELGIEICFPTAAMRTEVDDKISTNRIAQRADVPCVPYVLAKAESYQDLRRVSKRLGNDLVVQTAFGDSGHTTFFISKERDWKKHEEEIVNAGELKIMKRIRCRGSALEACVTKHGTIVGPLMTELVGFKELTPYRGGWCGNEVFAGAFDKRIRESARQSAVKFGNELRRMGYRGYVELDFLTDLDNGKVYLGEVNPRITGASSMTNLAAFAHADAPLFLFHLLEWMGVNYELDVDALNSRWANPENIDTWSQLVIKFTDDQVQHVTAAPRSGIWELNRDGTATYVRMQTHRRTVQYENRAFFLRITAPGDYFYEGADLGILVSPGRFMTSNHRLNQRAKKWISAIRAHYAGADINPAAAAQAKEQVEVGGFKLS